MQPVASSGTTTGVSSSTACKCRHQHTQQLHCSSTTIVSSNGRFSCCFSSNSGQRAKTTAHTHMNRTNQQNKCSAPIRCACTHSPSVHRKVMSYDSTSITQPRPLATCFSPKTPAAPAAATCCLPATHAASLHKQQCLPSAAAARVQPTGEGHRLVHVGRHCKHMPADSHMTRQWAWACVSQPQLPARIGTPSAHRRRMTTATPTNKLT